MSKQVYRVYAYRTNGLQTDVKASSPEEARYKASKKLPIHWNLTDLSEITIVPPVDIITKENDDE